MAKPDNCPLTYTPGIPAMEIIRTRSYTGEGANITLSSEEDTRLCGIANDDLSDDKDVEDAEDVEYVIDTAAELIDEEGEVSLPRLPGVSKGR